MSKFRVVLDTNAILSSLNYRSKYRFIIDELLNGSYDIFVTTEILLEYEEKINDFFAPSTSQLFLDALHLLPNVHKIDLYYKFLLIKNDADDDKFADCAIAAGIHFLVTDDKHFNTLLKLGFPKVNLINIKDFNTFLQKELGMGNT
jgi:uncharacterized protein